MGFRFAGSRPAALGSAAVLIFALAAGTAVAQDAAKSTAAPAAAATAAEAATKPGDATAGQAKAAACGACHGMDGNSTDPQYPKLAGQSEQYIVHQLQNFKSGRRQNPIMLGMATPLSEQ